MSATPYSTLANPGQLIVDLQRQLAECKAERDEALEQQTCGSSTAGAAEARDLIAPVYDSFTEGFDTPDLKEAKALLEELAA